MAKDNPMIPTPEQRREWGRMGGLIGGKRRKRKLKAKRRQEIARMGGLAKAAKAVEKVVE